MSAHPPISALTIAAVCAALHFPRERVLREWCRTGRVQAFRHAEGDAWLIPAAEVERLAAAFLTTPDWDAALDVDLA